LLPKRHQRGAFDRQPLAHRCALLFRGLGKRSGGDQSGRDQQCHRRSPSGHGRRKRPTAAKLPPSPSAHPTASNSQTKDGVSSERRVSPGRTRKEKRTISLGPSAAANIHSARMATAAPSRPCSAPSMRKGAFTNRSVAPTNFWISISSRRE